MIKHLILLAVLLQINVAVAQSAPRAPLEIAIFPYLSTRAIVNAYQPLQTFLGQHLKREVTIVTAPDMRTFIGRTQAGEYAFVLTAPHFARLAQLEAGYRPLLRATRNLSGLLLVGKNSPYRLLSELRGKTIAAPDSLAIVSMLGQALFKQHGLIPGKDVQFQFLPSHSSAVLAVQNGTADAVVVSLTAFMQMNPEQHADMRVLLQTPEVPHTMYLAHMRITEAEAQEFSHALSTFVEKTPEGKKFIEGLGHQGLRPPTEVELRSLDAYVDILKTVLTKSR